MIPVAPSFAFRDKATSADQQDQSDCITWLEYKAYGTYGQVTSAQSPANDTDVAVAWNSNVRSNKVTHSTVTNNDRITPQEPGLYLIIVTVQWTGNATGYRKLWCEQNGSGSATEGSVQHSVVGSGLHSMLWSGVMYFNGSTDYVRAMVRQTSGGPLALGFGEFNPRFNIMWQSGLA